MFLRGLTILLIGTEILIHKKCVIKLAYGNVTILVKGSRTVELRLIYSHNQSTVIRLINKIFMPLLNQVCRISKQCIILQGAEFKSKGLSSILGHLEPKVVTLTERVATGTHITGKNKAPKRIVCICGSTVARLPKTQDEHATYALEWTQN